ncbi:DNA translocase FtsK [Emticicia sp. TH156]|uniref:FtsK/SpoIIIE family DNA translocase n=1 Tax=Emticicia sp. TH156 TaxID=2067454 RepID=UPI000C79227E|nr:DNA translocase FtsK [Emticicia sp. TH156]PLK42708.1 cell division protein FtsK [Emticicia sp. TH156]
MSGNTFRKKQPPKNTERTASKGSGNSGTKEPIEISVNTDGYVLAFGVFLLVLSVILLVSFISHLLVGNADQDIVQRNFSASLEEIDLKPRNMMGLMGAYISHYFIFEWFGISAFGWIPVIFWAGFRLVFKKDLLPQSLNRFTIASVFYIFWASICLGYFVTIIDIPAGTLCGGIGYSVNKFLYHAIGAGGILIIMLVLVAWLIFFHGYSTIDDWFITKVFYRQPQVDIATERIRNAVQVDLDEEVSPYDEPSFRRKEPAREEQVRTEPVMEVAETPKSFEEKSVAASLIIDTEVNKPVQFEIEKPQPQKNTETSQVSGNGPTFIIEDTRVNEHQPEEEEGDLDDDDVNEKVLKDYGMYDPTLDLGSYQYPPVSLLSEYSNAGGKVTEDELEANKNKIVETMRNFQIGISSIKATIGPTVTLYEIVPDAGIRISKIKNLEDDIALNLSALGIRIIAPMPGKGTVGIEVPNKNREMVTMKSVISNEKFQKSNYELPIILGRTISNEAFITDLAKMPHLLMAGATGQGKSVGLNVILTSLLYKKHPSQIKFVLVDPKKVELTLYNKIERHFLAMLPNSEEAIITDTKKVIYTLNSLCIEMDNRYNLLKDAGVRNIREYNTKFVQRRLNPEKGHKYLPYIVLVIDELADLMMTAGKEVEQPIARLAQLARAIGIHLIVATQRPSVNVITGLIKANFPARLSFKVTSKIDSRTILDTGGSEQLVGNGDMLLSMGSDMIRLQCPFVDTPEVEDICEFIGSQRAYESAYMLPEFYGDDDNETLDFDASELDSMFEEAARLLVSHQQGSTSLIQRKMKLGYNRAGRIIDQLEGAGIVGPFEGSKAREVLVKDLTHLEEILRNLR